MVLGLCCRVLGMGPGVVRREDAADEGDDAQSVVAVVADGVDVPPEIAAGRDRLVESRCASSVAAALCPDSAAIGTPGPGCTPPPARYRPGTRLNVPGRWNDDIQPWVACP
jgi:hypothetical protein